MALYPPIIDTSRTMQLKNDLNNIKIYYTVNNVEIAETFEVSAIHPRTGISVLKDSNGNIVNIQTVSENTPGEGYITIPIEGNIAQVTLRRKTGTESSIPSMAVIFKLFDESISWKTAPTTFDALTRRFMGEVSINNGDELAWYQINISNTNRTLYVTDKFYPKTKNTIDEILNYDFQFNQNMTYLFNVTIGTRNGIVYSLETCEPVMNNLIIAPTSNDGTIILSNDNNKINVIWTPSAGTDFYAELYRRENDIWKKEGDTKTGIQSESGVVFNFGMRKRATLYRIVFKSGEVIKAISHMFWGAYYGEDILLKQDEDTQFLIKYNPEINQMKYNITDIITPTLGAKYPFIFRNGHQKYRSFSIGGLIARIDANEDIEYLGTNEDIIQERVYREKLLDFLYNDKIKLFSSAQEGEMLIKLSGVSVVPMKQLGRMLYSFSATATEVADCTEENLKTFGIEG